MRALLDLGIKSSGAVQQIDRMENKLGGLSNAANMAKTALAGIAAGGLLASFKMFLGTASDVQESTEKFKVVFADVEAKASRFADNLAKNFNFAKSAAISSLADTGDILTGFGLQAGLALDLSDKVNRLSADLASFTNYAGGAKGASEALTKALLGEREQAKMLGLVITEEAVKAQMALDAKNGEVYATEQAAKAYATYKVALSQSPNAIGDMARATEKYQYRLTALSNSVLTAKENIGEALIGPASKVIDSVNGMVKSFNEMDPAMRTVIVRTGAAAAILGTLGTVVGGLGAAFKTYCAISNIATATTAINNTATIGNTKALTDQSATRLECNALVGSLTASTELNTLSINNNTTAIISNAQALVSESTGLNSAHQGMTSLSSSVLVLNNALEKETLSVADNSALKTSNISTSQTLNKINIETIRLLRDETTRRGLLNKTVSSHTSLLKTNSLAVRQNMTAMTSNIRTAGLSTKTFNSNAKSLLFATKQRRIITIAIQSVGAGLKLETASIVQNTRAWAVNTKAVSLANKESRKRSLAGPNKLLKSKTSRTAQTFSVLGYNEASKQDAINKRITSDLIKKSQIYGLNKNYVPQKPILPDNRIGSYGLVQNGEFDIYGLAKDQSKSFQPKIAHSFGDIYKTQQEAFHENMMGSIKKPLATAMLPAPELMSSSLKKPMTVYIEHAAELERAALDKRLRIQSKLLNDPKYLNIGRSMARAGGKTGSSSFLLGSLFSKLNIRKLAGGWTGSFKKIFSSMGKLGTAAFRGLGFAVTKLIGPIAFVTTAIAGMGMVFKRLPYWLEIAIDQCWPVITQGVQKLVDRFPNIMEDAGKKLYGFFDGAWQGFRDFELRLALGGRDLFEKLTGKEMPEITTETQRQYAADKRAKELEKSAAFAQNAADAEKALQNARKLSAATAAQTAKNWAEEMRRMSMTKDEREAALRSDAIKKSETSLGNQINLGSKLAENNSAINKLRDDRQALMDQRAAAQGEAKAAHGDVRWSEMDVSGNSVIDNFLETDRTSDATKAARRRFQTSMATVTDLEGEIGKLDDKIRRLETNSDPKVFMDASNQLFASLAQSAGAASEIGKKYGDLKSQFETAAKEEDKSSFMESATDFFNTLGKSADVGSELGAVFEATVEEMAKAQAEGNIEAFMQALNKGYAAAVKDAGEDSAVAATFKELENKFKAAGQRFDPNQFMKSMVEVESKRLEDYIESGKYADELFSDSIEARLSQAKFEGEMKGGETGLNIQRSAQSQTLNDLLAKQARHQTATENRASNQARVDELNQQLTNLQTKLQDGQITDKNAYDSEVKTIQEELETLLKSIADARTPKEMQELQDQINDTRSELRDLEQSKFEGRLEKFRDFASDRQFGYDQTFSQIEQAMGRETKHGFNLSTDYAASVSRLSGVISERTKTIISDIDSQITMLTDSLATEDISDDERYDRERQIAELRQQKQTTLTDAQNQQLDLTDTLQERLRKQRDLKSQFAKVYDDMLLKEAKTADQKAAVYSRQFQELSSLMASARSDEEYLGYAQQMISLSEQIRQNYEDEAQKAMSRTWKTEGGVKAVTAGSAEAASIQNRVYNTSQKNIEKNTAKMVEVSMLMNDLLGKINERQEDGFTVEVAQS